MQRIAVRSLPLGMKAVFWIFLLLYLMSSSGLAAQGPDPAKPVDTLAKPVDTPAKPVDTKVRTHFKKWEEARSKIVHFDARILITEKSQPTKEITWRRVSVKYLKSDTPSHSGPYLEMRLCQWPEEMPYDYLICQDFFYVFNHEKEVVKSYEIGQLETYLKKLGSVKSLFGSGHQRFRESLPYLVVTTNPLAWMDRHDIKFLYEDEKSAHFQVLPLAKNDCDLFEKAQLTLSKVHGLPLALKWEEKNGTKLSYELEQIDLTRKWKPGHFRKPASFPECAGWVFEGPANSFPEEKGKEDPDQVEAAPFFQKWEKALAKMDQMDATIHARGKGDKEFLDAFPLRIKYWKTTKNAAELKNYDLSFQSKLYREMKRLLFYNDQLFYFQETEKTVHIVPTPGGAGSLFKNGNKNDDYFSRSINEFLFDFKYAFFTLTPNEIIDRFHVRLASEDDHYLYFELLPRKAKDKKVLSWANLVLDKKNFLLKTFSFENQAWDTYEFEVKHLDLDPKFRPEEREPPTEATWKGWKFVR